MLPGALRWRLIAGVSVILAAVILPAPLPAGPPDDLHALIPGDARMIAWVQARQMLDAPLGNPDKPVTLQKVIEGAVKDPKLLDLIPISDITTALIAVPSVGEVRKVFAVLRGRFDRAAIRQAAAQRYKDSFQEHGQGPTAILEFRIPVGTFRGIRTPAETYLAVPDARTCLIALGNQEDLTGALAGTNKGTPAELRRQLNLNDKKATISYALLNHLAGPFAELKGVRRAFELFQGVHGMIRFQEEPSGQAAILCQTPEAAREVGDLVEKGLNGITGAVALLSRGNKALTAVLDVLRTIRVRVQANQVTIRGKMERDTLEDLLRDEKK